MYLDLQPNGGKIEEMNFGFLSAYKFCLPLLRDAYFDDTILVWKDVNISAFCKEELSASESYINLLSSRSDYRATSPKTLIHYPANR